MSVFKASEVVVPSDLAERFDKATGNKEGFLRDLIADKGNLHHLEEELLAIGLMSSVKGIMEEKRLPDSKPLSVERLCNVIYVIMFAYCTGTMRVLKSGEVSFGNEIEDVRKAVEVTVSKKIVFANGKSMPTSEFMSKLQFVASPQSVGKTYYKVVKRHGLTKSVAPQDAFNVAKVAIIASRELIDEGK